MAKKLGIGVCIVLLSPLLLVGAVLVGPMLLFMRMKAAKGKAQKDSSGNRAESMYPLW